jgi:hypothetical protein
MKANLQNTPIGREYEVMLSYASGASKVVKMVAKATENPYEITVKREPYLLGCSECCFGKGIHAAAMQGQRPMLVGFDCKLDGDGKSVFDLELKFKQSMI